MQSNWSNKALHYAVSYTQGTSATVINMTEQCEQTERGKHLHWSLFWLKPARHHQASPSLYHTDRVNNTIQSVVVFLFRCAYAQNSMCMCFCIELQNSLRSWPSVKGSSSSLIHIIHTNGALISHATTNHTVFSWFTGHSTFRNPPLSHSWGG